MTPTLSTLRNFPTKSSTAQKRWFIHHSSFDLQNMHPASKKVFFRELRKAMVSITKLDKVELDRTWREVLESHAFLSPGRGEVEIIAMEIQQKILEVLESRDGDICRWKEFHTWILSTSRALYEYYTTPMGHSKSNPQPFSIDEIRQVNSTLPSRPKAPAIQPPSFSHISPLDITTPPQTPEPTTSTPSYESIAPEDEYEDDADAILSKLLIPINHLWSKPTFEHRSYECAPYTPTSRREIQVPDSPIFGLVSKEEEEAALHEHVAFECEDEEGRVWKEPRWKWEFGFC
ncbi:hypothetical protein ACMFMG_009460 [Clarireedia jacksonii]